MDLFKVKTYEIRVEKPQGIPQAMCFNTTSSEDMAVLVKMAFNMGYTVMVNDITETLEKEKAKQQRNWQ